MQPLPLSHPGHPGELVLLAAERTVTVTREEHHQDVLATRAGPVVVELRPCTITAGKHAGEDGLEVLLDGRRVGELTRLMAQRYQQMVDEVRARGYRAGCEAVLRDDARGVQVELRLPSATGRPATELPTDPFMIPARSGASRWPGRPTTAGSHAVPRQRRRSPGSTQVLPDKPVPYGVPAPPTASRRRSRRLFGVTGAVVGVLVLASALGNDSRDEVPAGNSSALPPAAAAPAVPAAVAPTFETTSAVPVAVPAEPAARSTVQARPPAPATSKPSTAKPTTSKTAVPDARAARKSAPKPEAVAVEPASNCHPSYSPCLPDGPDLDCGDINGQVTVKGPDEYRLDADDDGTGCDSN
jgi:hypothetical protein